MKKEIAILSLLILIPISYSLETDQIESYKAQEEIKGFQIDEKSVFSVSDNYLERLDEDNYWYETDSRYTDVELSEEYVLTGTRNPGRSVYLYKRDGALEFERMLPTWVDTLGLYNNSGTTLVGAGTTDYLALFYTDGELKSSFSGEGYSRYAPESLYNVQESENKNIAFGGGGRPTYARFQMASLDGEVEWRTEEKEDSVRGLNTPYGVLVFWRDGVSLKDAETGDPEWSRDVDGLIDPLNLSESFVYSTEDSLVFRSYEDGSVVDQISVDEKVENLDHYPGEDLFVGYQDNNLSFFGLDGEKKGSVRFDSLGRYTRFTDFTDDGDKEIAVSDGDEIKVLEVDPDKRRDSVDQELNETVFVGDSEQLFVSMALNRPVFVNEDSSSIDEIVEDTGLEKLDVESINSVNSVFDVDKTSYYVGDVSKLPYVSAFAAEDNATLTFDERRAEKDFSSKSKEELKKEFINRFEPNHVVVADLESEKGILAGYMAVEQGSLPAHFSEDSGVPDEDNSVIMLEEKIEESFELIGENQNTLFEGRYISILNGPQKTVENPVDGFFEDNDGEYYSTDLNYGNFEDDSYLNAAVARYPENTAEASKLFYRSTESEKWSDTTVASSYLHSNWPVILSTAGGGMRHGSQTEKVLRTETDTVHLVEHRADPVSFLLDLTPVEISGFLSETQEVEDVLAEFVSDNAASSVRNALIVIEVLSYAQQILEMYYEYDWSSYSFDFESSMDRVDDLEVPEDDSLSGVVQKSAVQAVYVFIWPERHSELTETGLVEEMDSDFVYYRGVGDESSWILPNDESGIVDDRYTGENSLEPGDIPEVDGVVWDNSDNAGKNDAELKNSFIENGAVAHLGFSSVSYSEHSSVVSYNFLSHGETLGQSMLEGVNSLRSGGMVYSPTTAHRSGVREKMSHSLMLEGNPETVKQSFGNNTYSTSHTCSEDLCSLRAEKSPEIEVLETGEEETLVYDADDYLLEPGKPITPLYRFSYPLPVEPEEVREKSVYETRENVDLPELELLTHNQVHNEDSIDYTTFPDKRYNSSYSNELSFVQSGIQKDRDRLKVLEKSVVEIDYRPVVTVELNRTGRTLTAELNSDKAFDSELVYSIDGESYTEEVKISEGENSFRLEELSKGSSEVELYVLNSTVLGYGEEQFRISRSINKTLSSENMVRGGRGEVTAYLDNPNSFETSKELALETDNLTQLGFLEDKVKEVTLEGHESETVSWSLTGLEKGSSVLNIGNSSTEAEVKPENYINRSEGLSLFRKMVSDRQSFEKQSSSSKVSLLFSSSEGSVEVVKSSEYLEKYLQTSQFSVSVTEEDGKVVRYVERSDGFFKQVLKNGEVRQYNEGVSREEFETYLEKLESETGKIYEWYELGHGFEKSED